MSIADKLTTISENVQKTYDAGYEKGLAAGGYNEGYNEGYIDGSEPAYRITTLGNLYNSAVFPENAELTLRVAYLDTQEASYILRFAKNLKKFTLVIESSKMGLVNMNGFVRENTDIEIIDFTNLGVKINILNYFALGASKLKSIVSALDLSECTSATIWLNGASALENIEFVPKTIKISIDFYWCMKLSKTSITSAINGLSDSTTGLAVSFSKSAVNKAFETAEGLNDGSTSTEWTALTNTKSNWNITLQ